MPLRSKIDVPTAPEESTFDSSHLGVESERNLTLSDLLQTAFKNRRFIGKVALACAVVAALVSLLLPNWYTATSIIMPPQQPQSAAAAIAGQLGAIAALAGGTSKDLGLKNPSDMYVGILKSRSIADELIKQFELQRVYREKRMTDTRRELDRHSVIRSGKDGLITIEVEDKDPNRAAKMANAYVQELYKANQRLAISEASQRRVFFEKQLEDEKQALSAAELELKKTQEATGMIQLSSQADAIIRAAASVRAQITAREVQLQVMRSFATEENSDVIRVKNEIAGLQSQLGKLENDEKLGGGNIQVPTGKVPQVGLEYLRRFREVKYHESIYELLAKQYEAARIDEGKNAPVIQVVDEAIPPDKKSSPPRTIIVLLCMIAGALLATLYVWYLPVAPLALIRRWRTL
jgi:uncharacterized protein involved in exopolysaccharide biosynthesis